MKLLHIKCDICGSFIGRVLRSKLRYPLNTGVFESIDPKHNLPAPFVLSDGTWLNATCPRCDNRPFMYEDKVTTVAGMIINLAELQRERDKKAKAQAKSQTKAKAKGNARKENG